MDESSIQLLTQKFSVLIENIILKNNDFISEPVSVFKFIPYDIFNHSSIKDKLKSKGKNKIEDYFNHLSILNDFVLVLLNVIEDDFENSIKNLNKLFIYPEKELKARFHYPTKSKNLDINSVHSVLKNDFISKALGGIKLEFKFFNSEDNQGYSVCLKDNIKVISIHILGYLKSLKKNEIKDYNPIITITIPFCFDGINIFEPNSCIKIGNFVNNFYLNYSLLFKSIIKDNNFLISYPELFDEEVFSNQKQLIEEFDTAYQEMIKIDFFNTIENKVNGSLHQIKIISLIHGMTNNFKFDFLEIIMKINKEDEEKLLAEEENLQWNYETETLELHKAWELLQRGKQKITRPRRKMIKNKKRKNLDSKNDDYLEIHPINELLVRKIIEYFKANTSNINIAKVLIKNESYFVRKIEEFLSDIPNYDYIQFENFISSYIFNSSYETNKIIDYNILFNSNIKFEKFFESELLFKLEHSTNLYLRFENYKNIHFSINYASLDDIITKFIKDNNDTVSSLILPESIKKKDNVIQETIERFPKCVKSAFYLTENGFTNLIEYYTNYFIYEKEKKKELLNEFKFNIDFIYVTNIKEIDLKNTIQLNFECFNLFDTFFKITDITIDKKDHKELSIIFKIQILRFNQILDTKNESNNLSLYNFINDLNKVRHVFPASDDFKTFSQNKEILEKIKI